MGKNKFIVSDTFVDIYKNFNVIDQTKEMQILDRLELMLLLIVCTDSYSDESDMVIKNFSPYPIELQIIYDYLPDISTNYIGELDPDLSKLAQITGDDSIDVSVIVDNNGSYLPPPLSDVEALIKRREINIENIVD